MPTSKVSKGITRFDLDDRHSHGYMVRICRNGQRYNEFFSDDRCGSKANAKRAAFARYEELSQELGPAINPTKNRITSRNSSGRVGVHLAMCFDKRWPNSEYSAYCASWVGEKGVRKKINFSCNKYGKKRAWELACLARDMECTDRDTVVTVWEKKYKHVTKKDTYTVIPNEKPTVKPLASNSSRASKKASKKDHS